MIDLLKQPLLHFLLLGVALFGLYELVGGEDEPNLQRGSSGEIVITAGRIDSLAQQFDKAWHRPPSEVELRGLIDEFIHEEVMVREALAMGLDRDDTIVRRRMQQKLEFLLEDTAALANPTDEQLQAHLDAHPESFARSPELSFVQIYFNTDLRGESAKVDARALLAQLRSAGSELDPEQLGDPLLLGPRFTSRPAPEVERQFGGAFVALALEAPLEEWQGPVESAYGLHLLSVRQRTEGGIPELAEVRDAVAREWAARQRDELNDATYERLRANYTVTVEGADLEAP